MFIDLETKRLRLKCIDNSDINFIFDEFTNDFINKYLFDQEPMKNIREAEELIEFYNIPEPRNQNRWVLIEKSTNIKIGTCGYHFWDMKKTEVEIGFELLERYCGNGFMSEAIESIINFAKLQMKVSKIKAIVYIENINCKKLLERFGFNLVDKKNDCFFRGKAYIHDIYEKIVY